MYHCRVLFYLLGQPCRTFETIKEMSPFENFTHTYLESNQLEEALAAQADVILADLQGSNPKEAVQALVSAKRKDSELILLLDKSQMGLLADERLEVKDIWICPMSEEEVRFRFLRWQQSYKMSKDFWETSHYLEATINNVPNLIWYKDKNGIHEKVNDSFCRTVNKTRQQVEGRRHSYIWDVEQDDPACIESEREVMNKRKTCVSEEHIQTGAGMRTLTTYKSPLFDLDGSVMGTVGVAIDVTRERIYEQEIVQKNQTLEKIFTTIDCGVMRHTVDGKHIISVNQAALRILGYESPEEMMADGFHMVAGTVLEEDQEKLRACIKSLKTDGDSVSTEYRVRHKNGELLHVMGNVKLLKENGKLFYQRFLLDCTAQKLQEQKNERQQMELIQALSIDYSIVCYLELNTGIGTLLRNNPSAENVFIPDSDGNIFFQESMEHYIQTFVHEDDREMLRQASSIECLKRELEEKNQYYVNYRTVFNGETEYFQWKAVRTGIWGDQNGVVLGFRSVDEEIRTELEKKSLLEDALIQAQQASRAKSVFLSNMSHDIRTPMNAIIGFTTLAIAHMGQKDQVEEYLKKIKVSGDHLLSLVNDVLDMSRIESGKIHLDEKPCHLPELLHELKNILQPDIHAKHLEFYMDAENIVNEDIYCDKLRLSQILLNLLSNAVKYTGAGGAIWMRTLEKAGAPNGYAKYEFHIKDTGIGMSKEFIMRVFEPFEREKNSTINEIQGTGLGMAITKNLIDMMNGTIEVKSEQGVGTEVTVGLTFRLYSERKDPQDIREWKEERALTADGDSDAGDKEKEVKHYTGRILLAEDNEINQEIAVAILEDAGFSVEVAENGQVAVDMLKESEPGYYQLILMDVQMPVMNGYEATKTIRGLENQALASIPILAMTANVFEEDRREALKSGMNGHLAKPVDVDRLFETLDHILS